MDHIENNKVIYRYTPTPEERKEGTVPEEYIICKCAFSQAGIVIYARNGEKIYSNPFQKKFLIRHLLNQVLTIQA